jgi:hypothetical protein
MAIGLPSSKCGWARVSEALLWLNITAVLLLSGSPVPKTKPLLEIRHLASNFPLGVAAARVYAIAPSTTAELPVTLVQYERLSSIELPGSSPNVAALDQLQDISDRRARAFQLLDAGMRSNDPKVIASAGQKLQQVDQVVTQRNQTR